MAAIDVEPIDINCDVPIQFEYIDGHENCVMATHDLKEDAKLFRFINTFGRKVNLKIVNRQWPTILNNGHIIQFPLVYFYFVEYTYCEETGK
jgi:hypothetical protein